MRLNQRALGISTVLLSLWLLVLPPVSAAGTGGNSSDAGVPPTIPGLVRLAGAPAPRELVDGLAAIASAVRAAHRLGVPAPVLESLLEETEAACLAQSH